MSPFQGADHLDQDNLEGVTHLLGQEGWLALVNGLTFKAYDAGHGMGMLGADLPILGLSLILTDGEIGFPAPLSPGLSPGNFSVAVLDQEGEVYWVSAVDGAVIQRGGSLVTEERVPMPSPVPLPSEPL